MNINSIRNKLEDLKFLVAENVDILVISETKLDESFPTSQFSINGFKKPFRYDRNANGGGILVYIRDKVPANEIKQMNIANSIECVLTEINVGKKKWALISTYRPPSQCEKFFFEEMGKVLDQLAPRYENFVIVGDLNSEETNCEISNFMDVYGLKNLIKSPTCYKSVDNPSSIDMFLTNKASGFQNTTTIEVGLSDFHLMILTVLKSGFVKKGPRIVTYRDYSKFDPIKFRSDLQSNLAKDNEEYSVFENFNSVVEEVLNNHVPLKQKYLRANDAPFMTKTLRKAIMLRTQLRNRLNRHNTSENRKAFKKQRNKCVKILRQAKRSYYGNLDMNSVTDNKKFWRTVKPLFTDKVQTSSSITLVENEKLITNDNEIAEIFNEFFTNITKTIDIAPSECTVVPTDHLLDPVEIAVEKFKYHPSIQKIKDKVKHNSYFDFQPVIMKAVIDQLSSLNPKKASTVKSIPARILKENQDIFAPLLTKIFNNSLLQKIFPEDLKLGDITSLFKNDEATKKRNYRPITVLSALSKVFERLLYSQMVDFADTFLVPYLCGFRKGFNTQHALLRLMDTCKNSLDKKGVAGALLMDLSKAFDCINHELLIAKLSAYGFCKDALLMIYNYLSGRKQRVKVNGSFSTWRETFAGVPQGSVLGPLLFNIYINDLFFMVTDTAVCNFADDTTIFAADSQLERVLERLETDALVLSRWFPENFMKLNEGKCHLLTFGTKQDDIKITIGEAIVEESSEERLLGVTIDKNLNFKSHVSNLCKRASQKMHALARVSPFMDPDKLRLLMNSFIKSQFSYCPLIWMFHDRGLNSKVNKIQERALRIVYKDSHADYETLLKLDNAVSIHQRNLQYLMIEIYKTKNNLNPSFMSEIFEARDVQYDLRNKNSLGIPNARTTSYGIETVRYLGQKLWQTLPHRIRESQSLTAFKKELRTHNIGCDCRLCRTFISGLGFI